MKKTTTVRFEPATDVLIITGAALVWGLTSALHTEAIHFTSYAPGIDLLDLPAGLRFLMILAGGWRAALGVALGSAFLVMRELGLSHPADIALVALCSGFAPYVFIMASLKLFGVDWNLKSLRAGHLANICLIAALGSSLVHNLIYIGLGVGSWDKLFVSTLAMATGDFTGGLLAVLLILAVRRALLQHR